MSCAKGILPPFHSFFPNLLRPNLLRPEIQLHCSITGKGCIVGVFPYLGVLIAIYVTLYQKFQEGECEKCRIIAYHEGCILVLIGVVAHAGHTVREVAEDTSTVFAGDHRKATVSAA